MAQWLKLRLKLYVRLLGIAMIRGSLTVDRR